MEKGKGKKNPPHEMRGNFGRKNAFKRKKNFGTNDRSPKKEGELTLLRQEFSINSVEGTRRGDKDAEGRGTKTSRIGKKREEETRLNYRPTLRFPGCLTSVEVSFEK